MSLHYSLRLRHLQTVPIRPHKIKELLQERVSLHCEKFGTWSLSGERVDQILNRKVPQELPEISVLGPQKRRVSRPSLEQESTTEEIQIDSVRGLQRD